MRMRTRTQKDLGTFPKAVLIFVTTYHLHSDLCENLSLYILFAYGQNFSHQNVSTITRGYRVNLVLELNRSSENKD